MVWSRAVEGKRGWLVAGVALVFILSTGILGLQLATGARPDPAGQPAGAPEPAAAAHGSARAAPAPAAQRDGAQRDGTSFGQLALGAERRLGQRGFQVTQRGDADAADCAANSYGRTRDFLRARPCAGLHRSLLEVRGPGGGATLVALAWVRMPDAAGAAALKAVLDKGGSGNINALVTDVSFTGTYYASARSGAVAVNADAHPIVHGLSDDQLKAIVTRAVG